MKKFTLSSVIILTFFEGYIFSDHIFLNLHEKTHEKNTNMISLLREDIPVSLST